MLAETLQAATDPRAFYHAKMFEVRQRHAKFADTPYSLEPNVKESPGGLRDLQSILWIARASGLAEGWGQLAARGLVTRAEAALLAANERKLKVLRAWLHIVAARREDRRSGELGGHDQARPALGAAPLHAARRAAGR